jgi:hypothetical protein
MVDNSALLLTFVIFFLFYNNFFHHFHRSVYLLNIPDEIVLFVILDQIYQNFEMFYYKYFSTNVTYCYFNFVIGFWVYDILKLPLLDLI